MPNPADCPLCRSSATLQPIMGDRREYACSRCGNYSTVDTAEQLLRQTPIQNPGAVSGWIRRQNSMGATPHIGSDVAWLRALTKPAFRERVERYLVAVADKTTRLDQLLAPVASDLIGISYSDDANDLSVILQYLQEQGLMTELLSVGEASRRLTPRGYIAADDLRTRRAASSQAFVAMSFTEKMKPVYDEGIEPAIRLAGFSPMLIRKKEHANKIDDEIIAEIRRSAFLVADFTGHRQNVYFETGFAIGLARQVVWTCRKDQIKDLHFDIRQYNCIDWENAAELVRRLRLRIEAMFGRGPLAVL
jgi:nucleoside 2-deoxyribosyltransferase